MKKVCVLTSGHQACDTRIFYKQAKSLVKAGYEVTVIGQHDKDEVLDGIKIISLPKPGNGFKRIIFSFWKFLFLALKQKADIYHFHDPELIPTGIFLRLLGYKVIYDVHEDLYCLMLGKASIHWTIQRPLAWILNAIEWLSAKILSAIVPATPKIAERFPLTKTVTIMNYPILNELLLADDLPYNKRPKSFIYPGVISRDRGIEEIVLAFGLLGDIPEIRLDLAGNIPHSGFINTLRSLPGWKLVCYHGQVSRKHLAQLLGLARAGLVLHQPIPNEVDALPIKLFEYMAASLPVIASDFKPLRKIINEHKCGLIVDQSDPKEIAKAVRWILAKPDEAESMGRRGRKAIENCYNWDVEGPKIIDLYNRLV